jgi:pimeloyl-ACP methyl ester carboxylesterase
MSARPPDQFTTVQGHRVRYWTQGESGPTVLLLHGISCSVLEWEHNIAALAQQHRVIAIDLLGCGLSDKPLDADYSMQAQARFVFACMDAMGLDRVHIVGNSMGGCIALECAAMHPERVQSLVLSAPAGIGKDTLFNFRLASVPFLGELLTKPSMFGLGMIWKLAFHDTSFVTRELVAEKVALAQLPNAQAVFLQTLRGFLNFGGFPEAPRRAYHARIQQVRCPSLVIWGRQDQFLPVTHVEVLKPLLANATYELVDQCGHVPMTEIAERFNRMTLDFLSTQLA